MGTTRSSRQERGASSASEAGDHVATRSRSAGSQGRTSRRATAAGADATKATAETKKRQKESAAAAGQAAAAAGLRSPVSTNRGTPGGPSRGAAAVTSSADTGSSPRKRSKPSGGGSGAGGSAAKRPRAPGILTTALGWARSQAAELEAFEQDRAAEGPVRPPPPLPLPTRRLAAAQHDLMKAMHQQQGRGGQGRSTRTNNAPAPRNALPPPMPAPPGVHPAAVAFAAGSDPQMAAMISTELTRLSVMAQTDPQRYSALAEECRAWAAGSLPTVAGLTSADLERAQKELHAAVTVQHRGGGGAGRPALPPDPRASSYFIQPFQDQDPLQASLRVGTMPFMPGPMPYGGGGGGGSAQRYPRRSSRGRNNKRDELYLTLDSEEEGDFDDEEDDGIEDARRWGGAMPPPPPGARRGPGRPRKHPLPHPLPSQFGRRMSTPKAPSPLGGLFMPPAGGAMLPAPDAVLSPFAQFLLDQDVGAGPNAGGGNESAIGADGVDFAALDDFISGLNFTNDALLLGSPGALAVLHVAKALSPPGTRLPGPMSAAAPGPLPAARQLLPPEAPPAADAPAAAAPPAGSPPQADGRTDMHPPLPASATAAAAAGPSVPSAVAPSSVAPPPPLQILELDLAACKPLETPTLAGMLSLAGPRKASTPGTSPGTDLLKSLLLSPTLLALNF